MPLVVALVVSLLSPLQAGAARCPVAAKDLARGTTLVAADIVEGEHATCGQHTVPADSLVGRLTRRLIRAGEPLREPGVVVAPTVTAGQSVSLIVQENGVRITMQGTATSTAMTGQRVWVRLGAKQRVQGVVAGRDLVIVSDTSGTS